MNDIQKASDIVSELAIARQAAPSEVAVAPDGTQTVIQWQGTPVTPTWLTAWVHKLMAAKLAEPYADAPAGSTQDAQQIRATNAARLDAWHRALSGLPCEGLEAARAHYERYGIPQGHIGYYLRPNDVSRWVRTRARRLIPAEKACEKHPDEWKHSCTQCEYEGPVEPDTARNYIAQIRADLAAKKDTP